MVVVSSSFLDQLVMRCKQPSTGAGGRGYRRHPLIIMERRGSSHHRLLRSCLLHVLGGLLLRGSLVLDGRHLFGNSLLLGGSLFLGQGQSVLLLQIFAQQLGMHLQLAGLAVVHQHHPVNITNCEYWEDPPGRRHMCG
jgi:hypothetical protein